MPALAQRNSNRPRPESDAAPCIDALDTSLFVGFTATMVEAAPAQDDMGISDRGARAVKQAGLARSLNCNINRKVFADG